MFSHFLVEYRKFYHIALFVVHNSRVGEKIQPHQPYECCLSDLAGAVTGAWQFLKMLR